jgi:uncharacterized protein CbrC (UPF0167 family)
VLTTNRTEPPEPYGLVLRRFIKIGPQLGNYGAAKDAEQLMNGLVARAPAGSDEQKRRKKACCRSACIFLGPIPPSHEAIEQVRSDLTKRIESLEQAVARYG